MQVSRLFAGIWLKAAQIREGLTRRLMHVSLTSAEQERCRFTCSSQQQDSTARLAESLQSTLDYGLLAEQSGAGGVVALFPVEAVHHTQLVFTSLRKCKPLLAG